MTSHIGDLIDKVQRRANRVDTNYRVRALDALDEALQWYSQELPWDGLIAQEVFLTTGSDTLVLPDRVLTISSIADITNQRHLPAGHHWARRYGATYTARAAGPACEWRPLGFSTVIAQPPADTFITAQATVSDSLDVHLRGLVRDTGASGTALELFEAMETLSLSSSEMVTSANSYVRVVAIDKPRGSLADVLIRDATTGTLLSRVSAWEARPMFPMIQLLVVPPPGTSLEIEYFRRPDRITAESHTIDPAIHEEALVWRAAGNMHWLDDEPQVAQAAWRQADEALGRVKRAADAFGERDHHAEPPTGGYMSFEGINWDLG